MSFHWRTIIAFAGYFALIACSPSTSSITEQATPEAQIPASPTATQPAATPRPAVQNGKLRIELFEWSISPEPFELPPGTYQAEIVNMGRRAHDLIIGGETDVQTRRLAPGQSQTLTIALKQGETTMWCSLADHRDMGMEAYLQVG